ncbi:MAG: SAP domain-containing protein [Desulfobacterota bacterium]|nr:SAP domain-containing protein [Thermodesulfobacteriota bacterium]
MKINEIRAKAKALGLNIALGMKKPDIIRAIQIREGNTPCFQTNPDQCGQSGCLWRQDCLKACRK